MQNSKISIKISHIAVFLFTMILISSMLCACTKKGEEIVLTPNEEATSMASTDATYAEASAADKELETEPVQEKEPETVFVHVCGAVVNEGVYELERGSRVIDAVNAAGGFDIEAETSYVNQAAEVSDGLKVRIPFIKEVEAISQTLTPDNLDSGKDQPKDGRININTATVDELCELPGIGAGYAQRIVSYREENGSFKTIEDIKNVKGIKDKLFSQIKDSIVV